MNVFSINGLHSDGCKNADEDRLMPLKAPDGTRCNYLVGPNAQLTLGYAPVIENSRQLGYELVAKDRSSGKVVCHRDQLVGVTFHVEIKDFKKKKKEDDGDYRIVHVAQVNARSFKESSCGQSGTLCLGSDRDLDRKLAAENAELIDNAPRVAYLIARAKHSQSVCMTPPPEEVGHDTPSIVVHVPPPGGAQAMPDQVKDVDKLDHVPDEDLSLYSIVVPGAVYDKGAKLITESVEQIPGEIESGQHWFNIACARDALAQTELLGLARKPCTASSGGAAAKGNADVSSSSVPLQLAHDRLPGLHMLTAKYYHGLSATTRGTPIAWCWHGQPKGQSVHHFVPEAVWNEDGATCLSHSRLWIPDKVVYVPTDEVKKFLNLADPKMCEIRFLQKICDEPLSLCTGEGIAARRIVQTHCPDPKNKDDLILTSYIPNHAPKDFQIITVAN